MRRFHKCIVLLIVLLFFWSAVTYRPLISKGLTRLEMTRLSQKALRMPIEFQNPAPVQDFTDGTFSRELWKFGFVSRDGRSFHPPAPRQASAIFKRRFSFQDPSSQPQNIPMPGTIEDQALSATLIGKFAFRPTPVEDVILKFKARAPRDFHGSAGAAFQMENTFGPDGPRAKPIDLFGMAALGETSSAIELVSFLTLGGIPVQVQDAQVDARQWHEYIIRLRWINRTNWMGTVLVDGKKVCGMPLPALSSVEARVWSDSTALVPGSRHWWEINPFLKMESGESRIAIHSIQVYAEAR